MGIQSADWIEEHEKIVNKKFKRLKMVITILKNITIQIFSIARKILSNFCVHPQPLKKSTIHFQI